MEVTNLLRFIAYLSDRILALYRFKPCLFQ
jgi:hypothetical protein